MADLDPFFSFSSSKNSRLDGKYRLSWVEESLQVGKAIQTPDVIDSGTSHIGTSFTRSKSRIFITSVILLFVLLLVRLYYLQIYTGQEHRLQAENNRQRVIPVPSERGLVYDRNGKKMTENVPNFSLAVIPQDLPKDVQELNALIDRLVLYTHQDRQVITDSIKTYSHYLRDSVSIQDNIDYETALSLQIEAVDLPGIYVQRGSKRLYIKDTENITTSTSPSNTSLSHVLGYMGKLSPDELDQLYSKGYLPSDSIGKYGVEKQYETLLRGIYGRKRIEVNAQGKEQSVLAEDAPQPGSHLMLSIDSNIQNSLERIMSAVLQQKGKKRASGVVLDPRNGDVLALVNIPSFDNNDFSGGISKEKYNSYIEDPENPLFNRAIAGTFPSGSSIKPAIAAAALEDGVITANTAILSSGGISVGSWFFPDWLAGGHGMTNVRKAIAFSVNTFFYYIGGGYGNFSGMGIEKLVGYLKLFGFDSKLGIDLPGEQEGFLPSADWKEKTKHEKWYIGDTYNVSIGQGDLLVTPLQIANMTATIANGGTLYKPHVAKAVIDPLTNAKTLFQPEVVRSSVMSTQNLATIRLGMRDCVTSGSCSLLSRLPFTSAGKTGTAQWNKNKDTHAWFTSFAPFENPEIVVTILVEEGGEGSAISEPIARQFYDWWWKYKNGLK